MKDAKLILKSFIRLLGFTIFLNLVIWAISPIGGEMFNPPSDQNAINISEFSHVRFLLVFLWMGVNLCSAMSIMGGWFELSRQYRSSRQFSDVQKSLSTVVVGYAYCLPTSYGGSVTVAITPIGLEMAVWPIFRLLHPKLLIPWNAIDSYRFSKN